MIRGLFGPGALTSQLRGGLEETSQAHRAIAARVAGALKSSSPVDGAPGAAGADPAPSLEEDMAQLADNQLRYEADAKLLQVAYARLRTAVRERA